MKPKRKRQKTELESKKSLMGLGKDKLKARLSKLSRQIPSHTLNIYLANNNSNFFTPNQNYQNTPDTMNFISQNLSDNYLNLKLNRIQSQYIKPFSEQSTQKNHRLTKKNKTKINVDSSKLKKQPKNKNQSSNDYFLKSVDQKIKNKAKCYQQNKLTQIRNSQQFHKQSLKTSKTSRKSFTKQPSSFENQPTTTLNLKSKTNINKKQIDSYKTQFKNSYHKGFPPTKTNNKPQTAIIKKNFSASSVRKYYVLHRDKEDINSDKKGQPLTTTRGLSNPEQHFSVIKGKQKASFLKVYDSSTDLGNTIKDNQIQSQIFQRVQKTLEDYQMNLKQEIKKRKALEIENSYLKEQLFKAFSIFK